jgi:hypothetical protein
MSDYQGWESLYILHTAWKKVYGKDTVLSTENSLIKILSLFLSTCAHTMSRIKGYHQHGTIRMWWNFRGGVLWEEI